jgi:hypothetical protein
MDKTWLQNLKVGDKVYVSGAYGRVGTIETVKRITKTMIIVGRDSYEMRYKKSTGYCCGDFTWGSGSIHQLTQERIDKIRVGKLKNKARELRDNLSIPQEEDELNKFIKALTPFMPK